MSQGGMPSIADLRPCPNPVCPGVVAPGDNYCPFCRQQLPAAPPPAPEASARPLPPDLPPPEPFLPPPPAGAKPPGGGFHIPRGVWVVLSILPLALCAVIAALALGVMGVPPGLFDRDAIPEVQKEAERMAWPNGTPTRLPTSTPTAEPTATRTATPSATPTATAAGAKSPSPTTSSHATYTPVVPNLPAGTATVPLQGNLYTGVKVYALNTREYMFQIVGRATDCVVDPGYFTTNIAYQTRRGTGKLEWWPEKYFDASNTNWVTPADDPALKTKQLTPLTGCGK